MKNKILILSGLVVLSALLTQNAQADTIRCALTDVRIIQYEKRQETVIYCNEFYAPLAANARVYDLYSRKVTTLDELELPLNAVLTTRKSGDTVEIISAGVGGYVDPDTVLYKKKK